MRSTSRRCAGSSTWRCPARPSLISSASSLSHTQHLRSLLGRSQVNSEAIDRKKKVGTAHVDNVEDAISAINLKHMPVYVLQASVTMREVVKGMSIYLWSDGGQPEHRPYLGMVGTIVRVDEVKGGSSKTGNSNRGTCLRIWRGDANRE